MKNEISSRLHPEEKNSIRSTSSTKNASIRPIKSISRLKSVKKGCTLDKDSITGLFKMIKR